RLLARLHLVAVVVAEQVQHAVRERPPPGLSDHGRTEDDVAEHARHTLVNRPDAVDRERQDVGHLVVRQVLALQGAHLLLTDEGDAELTVLDTLGAKHVARQLDRAALVDVDAASVVDLDRDHLLRSSLCSLYASTIRWTSL